jgi:hypothetical protein
VQIGKWAFGAFEPLAGAKIAANSEFRILLDLPAQPRVKR